MTFSVYDAERGIVLNLSLSDLGHPELPGLWEELRADKRPVPERQLQCMRCLEARPNCPEWMFLTERDGLRFASHFNRGIADHPTNESDEHKAYKERVIKAAELGGHTAEPEAASEDGKRRTDVLVRGVNDLTIGWEIQLAYISMQSVRKRTGLAHRDGITPLWATVDDTREFIDKVPWALMPEMEWHRIANGHELLVRGGVRKLRSYRCEWSNPLPCPVRGRGRCGKLHLEWVTARRVYLDDLVRDSAAGEYVPIVLPGKRVRRWWVRPAERDRYADAVGGLAAEEDLAKSRSSNPESVVAPRPLDPECRYGVYTGFRAGPAPVRDDGRPVVASVSPTQMPEPPAPIRIRPGHCGALADPTDTRLTCDAPARFYACGWRCDTHRPVKK